MHPNASRASQLQTRCPTRVFGLPPSRRGRARARANGRDRGEIGRERAREIERDREGDAERERELREEGGAQ